MENSICFPYKLSYGLPNSAPIPFDKIVWARNETEAKSIFKQISASFIDFEAAGGTLNPEIDEMQMVLKGQDKALIVAGARAPYKVLRKVRGGEWGDTGERVEAVSPAHANFLYLQRKPEYRGQIQCELDIKEYKERQERKNSQQEIEKNKPKRLQEFLQNAWWND